MSASNGTPVIKIGKKGIRRFQIGDDGPVFDCDVVTTYNRWIEIQEQFLNAERQVNDPRGYTESLMQFVSDLQHGQPVSGTEASEFLAVLIEEQDEMRNFFDIGRRGKLSSPAPSAATRASGSTSGAENSSGAASNRLQPGKYSTTLEVMPDV